MLKLQKTAKMLDVVPKKPNILNIGGQNVQIEASGGKNYAAADHFLRLASCLLFLES